MHGYPVADSTGLTLGTAAEARWNPGGFPDNYRLTCPDRAIDELRPFVEAGGGAVVDATPVGLGRDPGALARISAAADVKVVMGAGFYLEPTHPPRVAALSVEELAAEFVAEFTDGVGGTGIRPGILGELGTGDPITGAEEKVLRAAAVAHHETGLALSVHLHPWSAGGHRVLDVVSGMGVNPRRVVLNHLTTAIGDDDYQLSLLERGAFLAYDLFGFDHSLLDPGRYPPSDVDVAKKLVELVDLGYLGQVLISQDVGVKTRLLEFGGWGYAHLLNHVVPLLLSQGLGQRAIDQLLVENPRRVLTVTKAGEASNE